MRAFLDDCGEGVGSDASIEVDLRKAQDIWSDLSGIEGNFLGLIDDQERTIQFHFLSGIPDEVDDARHSRIVLSNIPCPDMGGSYNQNAAIGGVHQAIEAVFAPGADHQHFSDLTLRAW